MHIRLPASPAAIAAHCLAAPISAALVLAALSLAATGPAWAQGQPPAEFDIDIDGWQGGAFPVPDTNEFSHCAIERTYDEDITLAFLMNDAGRMAVGIGRPDWALDAERKLPAQVAIDGGEPKLVTASPASDRLLILPIGDDQAMKTALQRGNEVSVTSELISHSFALIGTFKGINALTACVAKAIELAQSGPPPSQRMTAEVIAQLMDSAGITGIALASPDEIAEAKLPIEQAWRIGPLRGALHQVPRTGEGIDMAGFVSGFTAEFEALCPGPFASAFQPTEEFSGRYALTSGTLTCEGEEATTHTEMVVVLDDSFYTAFVHEGRMEDAETAATINQRLGETFRAMIGADQPVAGAAAGE